MLCMSAFSKRLKAARTSADKSQESLGKVCGVSRAAVTQWESGKSAPTADKLESIANFLNVDAIWLITGKRSKGDLSATEATVIKEIDIRAGAGGGGLLDPEATRDEYGNSISSDGEKSDWAFPDYYLREIHARPDGTRIIEIIGDSMEPTLSSGDRVMIDTGARIPSPPGVFALWDGLGVVTKRVEHVPNTDPPRLHISSDNPHHESYDRTIEEVNIIGRVIWLARRM